MKTDKLYGMEVARGDKFGIVTTKPVGGEGRGRVDAPRTDWENWDNPEPCDPHTLTVMRWPDKVENS